LDVDGEVVDALRQGRPPLHEPGLAELLQSGVDRGVLSFSTEPESALADAEVLWVAFDTPVNDNDEADVAWVRQRLDRIVAYIRPATVVLFSSQVPVGFTAEVEKAWAARGLAFAVSPENLRLGKALDCFRKPERVVVGVRDAQTQSKLGELLKPFCEN